MPQVDPLSYLIAPISNLTGGLIHDLQTLILGVVFCLFLLLAFELLEEIILVPIGRALTDPARLKKMYQDFYISRLPPGPSVYGSPNSSTRSEIEISPLRQYDLDLAYRGVDSLPESPISFYDQKENNWERDGVDLSEERYRALEEAFDESAYNERNKHRMSSDEVDAMFIRMRRS